MLLWLLTWGRALGSGGSLFFINLVTDAQSLSNNHVTTCMCFRNLVVLSFEGYIIISEGGTMVRIASIFHYIGNII